MSAPSAVSCPYSWQEEDKKTKGNYQPSLSSLLSGKKKKVLPDATSRGLTLATQWPESCHLLFRCALPLMVYINFYFSIFANT